MDPITLTGIAFSALAFAGGLWEAQRDDPVAAVLLMAISALGAVGVMV